MSDYFRKYIKKEHFPVHPTTVKFKTNFKNCILEVMKKRQWKEQEEDFDIIWTEKEWISDVLDHCHLTNGQKLNHFRNYFELCRKDLLIKNLKKYKKQLEKEGKNEEAAELNFVPLTYLLPSEYSIFFEEFKKHNAQNDSKQLWIMKPISRAQGKGIFIFKNIKEISQWKNTYRYNPDNPTAEPYVVQKYINDPLLMGGKKFDLRLYALCVSYSPLTVYLYRTGFARFTHHRYDPDDITNHYVHLTNVAVQKTSDNYDEKQGGKWFLQSLKLYLIQKYGQEKVSESFYNIQQIIIKSLQAVQKQMMNDKRCFELYGFDILLDMSLKPWLLEVNGSPSMTANTQCDNDLKQSVLDDVFTIVDMEKILTGQEEQIGGFDLIYKGAPVKLPNNSTYTSLLGCYNNRNQQLKKLAKSTSIRLSQQYAEQQAKQQEDQKQRSNSKGPTSSGYGGVYKNTNLQRQAINKQSQVGKASNIPKPINSNMQKKVIQSQINTGLGLRQQQQQLDQNQATQKLPGKKNINGNNIVQQQQQVLIMQQQQQQQQQLQQQFLSNQLQRNNQGSMMNQKINTNQKFPRQNQEQNFVPYKKEQEIYGSNNQGVGDNEDE